MGAVRTEPDATRGIGAPSQAPPTLWNRSRWAEHVTLLRLLVITGLTLAVSARADEPNLGLLLKTLAYDDSLSTRVGGKTLHLVALGVPCTSLPALTVGAREVRCSAATTLELTPIAAPAAPEAKPQPGPAVSVVAPEPAPKPGRFPVWIPWAGAAALGIGAG